VVGRRGREDGPGEGSSAQNGGVWRERLRELDQVAYVRFASVYRQFADVGALRRALDELEARTENRGEHPAHAVP